MEDITLKKALGEYETIYMAYRNFADGTRVEYMNDLEGFVEFAEKAKVNGTKDVSISTIQRFVAGLEQKGYSSLTRKRKVVAIRSFFAFLYQDGFIHTNISSKVILPFTETTTPHILTQGECDRLRTACSSNKRDRAIIELLLHTGITLSELRRLTLNDIDLAAFGGSEKDKPGFVRLLGNRAKKERIVPLSERVCHALKSYLDIREKTGTSIFFLNRFGEAFSDRGIQKMLRKYVIKADIEHASVRTLRHTFGAYHLAKGKSLEKVREVMGLRDVRSTAVYGALTRETSKEIQNNTL